MNMLFAILYYGDSQIRFEGANGVSSDGLIVDKAGIEGWWSAPDLKTDVTERASGNGAHDVSVDSILYASRTVTVHFDAIGDAHGEVLDAVTKVSQANGMPVRLRVVDDQSDTFVSGFIRPQFGSGWNERHQTGTLTIVCPRPERLAWSTLQSQLFPVSMVQGGLRYSTTHELVSSWTGTPDASTSTLSQDGQVVATNLAEDPAITHTLEASAGGGTWVRSPDATSPTGFSWTFTAQKSDWQWLGQLKLMGVNGLVSNPHPGEKMHVLLYAGTTLTNGCSIKVNIYNGTSWAGQPNNVTIAPGPMSWSDTTFTMPADPSIKVRLNSVYPIGTTGTVTIGAVMLLTDTDWKTLQSLGIDWFSGDSYPVPTGKGLSYPLNYGTGGVTSNVALLTNQGSSKAFPILTVTGNFLNGVQIQWGGNALQYDSDIGAVPLILDSRSQTASMGGVDVSRNLSRRDFPMVPGAGSVSLRLMSAGTGWVTAVCRDTYI